MEQRKNNQILRSIERYKSLSVNFSWRSSPDRRETFTAKRENILSIHRNILRKFKKKWFDLVKGLKRVFKIKIYKFSEGISEFLLFARIGVEGGVNPPGGIRVGLTYQTPSEAYDFSHR